MLASISKHLEQHNRLLLKLHVRAFKAMVGSTLTTHDSDSSLGNRYCLPPRELLEIFYGQKKEFMAPSPCRRKTVIMYKQTVTTLSELSKPHEKLAGLRIDDDSNMTPHVTYYTNTAIKMEGISTKVTNLPNGAKIRSVKWSNDSQHICFSVQTNEEDDTGSKLKIWVANVETKEARHLFQNPNTFYNPLLAGFIWIDNSRILVPIIPPNRVRLPSRPKVPFGPKIDCNEHMDTIVFRTYQELLKDEYDEDLLEYFATSELVLASLDGTVKAARAPAIYVSLNLKGNVITIEYKERPFSYFVPFKQFKRLRVLGRIKGRTVKECNRSSMDWSTKAASKHTGVSSQNTNDSGSNKDAKQECLVKKKFSYPYPVKDIKKITFKRKDMVELKANLCLPLDYNQAKDGPLPCIIWPYPNSKTETKSSEDEYYFRPLSPLVWLVRGFAVLSDIRIPIKNEEKAYDGYVEELVSTVEAAVQEVIRLGVAHPKKIVIGGKSFGATMTALLLQHASHLFCCGIAWSGAYNRTLTPFSFQRTFWEAKSTYVAMSPFISADKIKKPILLVHGEDDSNPGTWTMQSTRFYKALIANVACCRLVILPFEDHTYLARENILHVLWETDRWLQKYCVANSGASTDEKV